MVWILSLPYGVGLGNGPAYLVAFIVFMLALDAVFTYAVWRSGGRRHDAGVDFWLLFVFLVGPLSYVRFDMIPAVLAGGALLAARTRPWVAGALTGLGAAIKLWPALLIPVLLADKERRKPTAIGFVVVGFGLALISLITGGLTRLFSPLTWQSGRGLQIESIWATPLMLLRMVRPEQWVVEISRYQAYEIFGAGRGTVADHQQRGHRARSGDHRGAVGARVPDARWGHPGRGRPGGARHRHRGDHHQQDPEPAVPALDRRPDRGPAAAPRRRHRRTCGGGSSGSAWPGWCWRALTQLVYPLLYDGYLGFTNARRSGDRHPGDRRAQRVPAGLHGDLPRWLVLAGYFIVPWDTEPCS